MKFTQKTQMFSSQDQNYERLGYVCFRYTGQQMVKDFAKSKPWKVILEPLDTVVYDSIKKRVAYVLGTKQLYYCVECTIVQNGLAMKFTRKSKVWQTINPGTLLVQYTGQTLLSEYYNQAFPSGKIKPLMWFKLKRLNGRLSVVTYYRYGLSKNIF